MIPISLDKNYMKKYKKTTNYRRKWNNIKYKLKIFNSN